MMKTDVTFWFNPGSADFFLIPDDVEPPAGELQLLTLTGKQRLVDVPAVAVVGADLADDIGLGLAHSESPPSTATPAGRKAS